jgi:DNA polymerase-3 subunit gamma/tau
VTSTAQDKALEAVPGSDAAGNAPDAAGKGASGAVERATPHQAIYRAWRAQTFAGIVGQDATVAALRNAVRTDRVAHALLFVGPRGTGKTSMARIVAKALNCTDLHDGEPCDRCAACVAVREGTSLDVAEMDAASNNKVDDMRDLLPRIATAPSDLRRKVFIIDEVQRIKEGWDVLLKTLEEPPDHVAFIFCTTDAGGIRPAILSRVQRYDFRKLTVDQIAGKLRHILAEIGRQADDDAIDLIARAAAGGMRDAESMLDQLLSGDTDRLTADRVRDTLGLASGEAVDGFVAALVDGDGLAGLAILDGLDERGRDVRTFLDQVMEAVRARLVAGLSGGADPGAARLTAIGRRLAAIDPARLGPGGLRFQLELVVLDGGSAATPAPSSPVGTPVMAERPSPAPARVAPVARPAAPTRDVEPPLPEAEMAPEARPPRDSAAVARRSEPAVEPLTAEPVAAEPVAAEPVAAELVAAEPVATEPGAAPSAAVADPAAGADMAALLAAWPVVVREMSRLPALKQLIIESRPIAVEDGVVTLGFPEGRAFLRDAADKRKSAIEDGLAKVIGRTVLVRCVVTNLDVYPPLADDADAERLLSEARRIFADDLADVGEVD